MDYIRISIRTRKGFRVILQGLLKDSTTDFRKWCCRDSEGFKCDRMGFYRDVFYGISIRIPKGFLLRFYIDFYKGFIRIQRDS